MIKRLSFLAVAVALTASPALAADKKIGRTYKSKCQSCHGADGKGETEKGKKLKIKDMTTAEWQKITDEEMIKQIKEGPSEAIEGMAKEDHAFADLGDETIKGLVTFVREFKK